MYQGGEQKLFIGDKNWHMQYFVVALNLSLPNYNLLCYNNPRMSLSVGIVGLPNVGKSTLFNALLSREIAQVAEYPFTTIESNTGVVEVPEERLDKLSEALKITKKVPAAIKFIDIAGLVKGAHRGEGLGNKFLSHVREVDVILHVVREFRNRRVSHISGQIDPIHDMITVNLELILADFEVVAEALKREKSKERKAVLEKLKKILGEGRRVARASLAPKEEVFVQEFNLLTSKPMIFVINTDEDRLKERKREEFSSLIKDAPVVFISARLEADLIDSSGEERREYLQEVGVEESCLGRLIKAAYKTLGLISFFTVKGAKQVQAWPLKQGANAVEAAARVHTQMAKGFIKAEAINWQDLVKIGSWQKAREKGKLRLVGRDYQLKDGEVVEFKFN